MNSPPIVEPILVVGLVDVHWGLTDLDFGPWPIGLGLPALGATFDGQTLDVLMNDPLPLARGCLFLRV